MIIYTLPRAIIVHVADSCNTKSHFVSPGLRRTALVGGNGFWKNSWPWWRADIAHGHFEISVSGEDGKAGCTSVIITAGKKFKFLVPKQQ